MANRDYFGGQTDFHWSDKIQRDTSRVYTIHLLKDTEHSILKTSNQVIMLTFEDEMTIRLS